MTIQEGTIEHRLSASEQSISDIYLLLDPPVVSSVSVEEPQEATTLDALVATRTRTVATPFAQRAKRIIETPLGSRVMLPNFGSRLYELVDRSISDEFRLKFIAYAFEAFWDTDNKKLWDAELEPQQIIFTGVNDKAVEATIKLKTGEVITYE